MARAAARCGFDFRSPQRRRAHQRRRRSARRARMPAADESSVERLRPAASRHGNARSRAGSADGIGSRAADRARSGTSPPIVRSAGIAAERNHALDQSARVRMLRVGEDPLDAAVLDHLARVHHADVVGELGDETEIVRDEDHRRARVAPDRPDEIDDLRLHGHVERGRRLVEDQQPRPPRHRHRDHHALAHAARELVRIRVEHALRIADPELAQEIGDARGERGVARESRVPGRGLGDLLAGGQQRIEIRHRILEDVADRLPAERAQRSRIERREVDAVEHDAAVASAPRRRQQAEERAHRDGFAAARLADEADDFACVDVEVDAFDGANGAAARARKLDAELAHRRAARHDRRAHRSPSPCRGSRTSFKPVAEQVEPERRDEDRYAGEHRHPPALVQERLREEEELPPAYLVRVAQAEKAQARLGEDRRRDLQRRVDDDRRQRIGQDLAEDQRPARRSGESRGGDEVLIAQLQEFRADDARGGWPAQDRDDQHDLGERGAEQRHDEDREKELRDDLEPFGDAHEQLRRACRRRSPRASRSRRRESPTPPPRPRRPAARRARRWRRGRACRGRGRRCRTGTPARAGRTCARPSPTANR